MLTICMLKEGGRYKQKRLTLVGPLSLNADEMSTIYIYVHEPVTAHHHNLVHQSYSSLFFLGFGNSFPEAVSLQTKLQNCVYFAQF